MEKKEEKKVELKIEELEERIAPWLAGDMSGGAGSSGDEASCAADSAPGLANNPRLGH